MNRRRAAAVVAAVAAVAAACGCAGSRRASEPAPYSAHLAASLAWDERGAPRFRIAAALPRAELAVLAAGSADAWVRLVLSARVTTPGGRSLGGEVWTRQIAAHDLLAPGDLHWCVELNTLPGAQELALAVLVQGQPWGAPWRRGFEVPAPVAAALYLGEPLFVRTTPAAPQPAGSAGDSACDDILVGRYYDANHGPPRLRTAAYDFAAGADSSFELAYVVRSLDAMETAGDGVPVAQGSWTLLRQGWITPAEWQLPALGLGRHVVELRLQGRSRSATAEGRFEIGLADLAALAASDGGVGLLRLLLSAAEVDSLRRAPPDGRESLWQEFWRRRDPEPSTPANEALAATLARVRQANLRFGGVRAGWRTDRGRVYITYGAPDTMDTLQNPEGFDRIERWTYTASNTVFVFVDRDGRGEYVLLRTNAPEF